MTAVAILKNFCKEIDDLLATISDNQRSVLVVCKESKNYSIQVIVSIHKNVSTHRWLHCTLRTGVQPRN